MVIHMPLDKYVNTKMQDEVLVKLSETSTPEDALKIIH